MPRALFSLWDKTGSLAFASELHALGWELVASGGTAQALADGGVPVIPVTEITGEQEMFDGRVKTLHPAIHAALLARSTREDRQELARRGWSPIDLVAVNLYPFEEIAADPKADVEQVVENIDIGGVTLLRAGAKNFARVTVLCDPQDYALALDLVEALEFRKRMAIKAFQRTADYEAAIAMYFSSLGNRPAPLRINVHPVLPLRYGENPHQRATFYSPFPDGSFMGGNLLHGKPLSYNNLLDLDAACRTVALFPEPTVAVIKHTSPCGLATSPELEQAVALAIAGDPVSAFGSVIGCNQEVDEAFLEGMGDLFVECLIAPGFTEQARARLEKRENIRLLEIPGDRPLEKHELRSALGGLLWQTRDEGDPPDAPPWRVVTERAPSEEELNGMRFSWKACQGVKSNAIVLARSRAETRFIVGVGGGQPNRVDCVRIAGERAGENAKGSVMASDAFFPFPDGVEVAASLGVTAVVQPGGSIRDEAVIQAAQENGIAMVFTGVRHFRH